MSDEKDSTGKQIAKKVGVTVLGHLIAGAVMAVTGIDLTPAVSASDAS